MLLFRSQEEIEEVRPDMTFRSLEGGTRFLYRLCASIVGRDAEGEVVSSASSNGLDYIIQDPDPDFLKGIETPRVGRRTMSREEHEQLP